MAGRATKVTLNDIRVKNAKPGPKRRIIWDSIQPISASRLANMAIRAGMSSPPTERTANSSGSVSERILGFV